MDAVITPEKYKLEDLEIGMEADEEQLSDIYDTWIILYKPVDKQLEHDGIIGFIGEEPTDESYRLHNDNNIIIPIYHNSMDLDGDISYDE